MTDIAFGASQIKTTSLLTLDVLLDENNVERLAKALAQSGLFTAEQAYSEQQRQTLTRLLSEVYGPSSETTVSSLIHRAEKVLKDPENFAIGDVLGLLQTTRAELTSLGTKGFVWDDLLTHILETPEDHDIHDVLGMLFDMKIALQKHQTLPPFPPYFGKFSSVQLPPQDLQTLRLEPEAAARSALPGPLFLHKLYIAAQHPLNQNRAVLRNLFQDSLILCSNKIIFRPELVNDELEIRKRINQVVDRADTYGEPFLRSLLLDIVAFLEH